MTHQPFHPTHTGRRIAAGAMVALLAACDVQAPERPAPNPGAPPRASVSAVASGALFSYVLTREACWGLWRANHALWWLQKHDPEPIERLEEALMEVPPDNIDLVVATIEAEPAVRAALDKARVSARDFYVTQFNLVQAVAILEARAAKRTGDFPPISEANLEFVRRNPYVVHRVMNERAPQGS